MMCDMPRRLGPAALPPMWTRVLVLSIALTIAAVGPASAEGESTEVSRITDPRIEESSGLAVSAKQDDLAYTINDAGNDPVVYAVTISTGEVVGTTRVAGGDIEDTESISVDGDGTIWLADLGDNDEKRDDVAIYSFAEPGPGDNTVTADRFPVSYDAGPVDVEALLVHPSTGAKFLATKVTKESGAFLALPKTLSTSRTNLASDLDKPAPEDVSGATFTSDGSQALVRTRDAVHVFDPETWEETRVLSVPEVKQGESISMESDGTSFLIGSEGKESPLIRVAFDPTATDAAVPSPAATEGVPSAQEPNEQTSYAIPAWLVLVGGLGAVGVLAGAAWLIARRP